jgi:hypothetical protein
VPTACRWRFASRRLLLLPILAARASMLVIMARRFLALMPLAVIENPERTADMGSWVRRSRSARSAASAASACSWRARGSASALRLRLPRFPPAHRGGLALLRDGPAPRRARPAERPPRWRSVRLVGHLRPAVPARAAGRRCSSGHDLPAAIFRPHPRRVADRFPPGVPTRRQRHGSAITAPSAALSPRRLRLLKLVEILGF